MKKVRKLLFLSFVFMCVSVSAYAMEVSVGASAGYNLPLFRGEYAKSINELAENAGYKKSFGGLQVQADVMLEFLPFLALQTGIGIRSAEITYKGTIGSVEDATSFLNGQMVIPVMLRAQYEYNMGVTYISAGLKLGIPYSGFMSSQYGEDAATTIVKNSSFALDAAFAVGQEFRLGKANYIGLKVGYDLNVIAPYDNKEFKDFVSADQNLFLDGLNFSITYRYAFGSKWK